MLVKNLSNSTRSMRWSFPGGESTTFLKFLEKARFLNKLREFVRAKPTFGACAGAILLASEVEDPPQPGLGALNISVRRNA